MKKLLLLLGMCMLLVPSAFAIDFGPLTEIMQFVFELGSFVWVTDLVSATKFAIFILIFAVVYGVLHSGFVAKSGVLNNKKVSVVISFVFAAITVLFLPDRVALEIGNTYSAIAALILAGIPAGLLLWFGFEFTKGDDTNKILKHAVRFIALLAVISILTGIGEQYGMFFILPLFWRSDK